MSATCCDEAAELQERVMRLRALRRKLTSTDVRWRRARGYIMAIVFISETNDSIDKYDEVIVLLEARVSGIRQAD